MTCTSKNRTNKECYAKYMSALFLFGTNGVVASGIALDSIQIVFFRTLLGCLMLGAILGIKCITSRLVAQNTNKSNLHSTNDNLQALNQQAANSRNTSKITSKSYKDLLLIIVSGALMGLSWIFQFAAYSLIGVAPTALIFCLGPVFVVAMSPLIFGEKFKTHKTVGFIVALTGVLLVSTGNVSGSEELNIIGILLALACAMSYAGMVVFNKLALNIKRTTVPLIQLTSAFITTAICCSFVGKLPVSVPHDSLLPILILGLINTGLGCYLYFSNMDRVPAQSVAITGYIEPMLLAIMAGLFLGESLSIQQLYGAALITCGVLGCELKIRTRALN